MLIEVPEAAVAKGLNSIMADGHARARAALDDAHEPKVGGRTEPERDTSMVATLHAAPEGNANGPAC